MATLSAIDLRTSAEREGITKTQQTIQSLTNILKTVGQAEQVRQERQDLDRIATALAGGASTVEAIAAVAKQKAEFSSGIQGMVQRLGSAFQPSPGGVGQGIDETVIGSKLREILSPSLLSTEEQRELKLFGQRERPGTTVAAPSKQQTQRDRDLAIIANEKKTDFQKQEARKRLDEDPSLPRKTLPSGKDFKKALEEVEQTAKGTVAGTLKEGKRKLFGKKAYNKLLARLEDLARMSGFEIDGVKTELDRWWDAKVQNERGGKLGGITVNDTLTPRSEFQEEGEIDIGTTINNPETGERREWNGKKWETIK